MGGTCPINEVLGRDELVHVLDWLSPQQVVICAALVCRRWAEVALSDDVWKPRVPTADSAAMQRNSAVLAALPLRRLYPLLLPRQLLRNSLLQAHQQVSDNFGSMSPTHPWMVTMHRGQGWAWEHPGGSGIDEAVNAALPQPLPALGEQRNHEAGVGAVASSYMWCELMQPVDLVAALQSRGFTAQEAEAVLDSAPSLEFSVCYGARFDCGAECEVVVVLDKGDHALPSYVARHSHPWDQGKLAAWHSTTLQPEQNAWHTISAVLNDYPKGVRRAIVVLRGKDRQFWAGHYGAKFASPQLVVLSAAQLPAALERHGVSQRLEVAADASQA